MTQSDRRAQLLALKLTALVRDHCGEGSGAPGDSANADVAGPFGRGAAFVRGSRAWVFVETHPERGLGPAMAWARQHGAAELNVLAERGTGVIARQAANFAETPIVWHVEGRVLLPAIAEPFAVPPTLSAEHQQMLELIVAGGAEPSVEHGVLTGEVAGLEVCRVVTDRQTNAVRLEVGVGAHDREAFQIIHGDRPTVDALRGVVEAVSSHRGLDSSPHPLSRLAAERLLRWRLIGTPSLIGLATVSPVEPPVPRVNLKDATPAVAVGATPDGTPVVVVCSVGVDLDLVPYAADARAAIGLDNAPLLLVMPERDALAVTVALAGRLINPATVVTV